MNTLPDILAQLTHAITTSIDAANARATAAEATLAKIAAMFAPVNDNDAPSPPPTPPTSVAEAPPRTRPHYPDAIFVEALTRAGRPSPTSRRGSSPTAMRYRRIRSRAASTASWNGRSPTATRRADCASPP